MKILKCSEEKGYCGKVMACTYSGRYCISDGKLRSVFFLLLIISSTSTPKLYMSAFSDNSPLMAYSGAV